MDSAGDHAETAGDLLQQDGARVHAHVQPQGAVVDHAPVRKDFNFPHRQGGEAQDTRGTHQIGNLQLLPQRQTQDQQTVRRRGTGFHGLGVE